MKQSNKNLVVVFGSSATALAIVRELSTIEGLVIVIASKELGCAVSSKYINNHWLIEEFDEILHKIKEASKEFSIALMPSSDLFVEWICNNARTLKDYCYFDECYASKMALDYLDKDIFSEIIKDNNFEQPLVESIDGFDRLSNKYFPVFIKPKLIHQKKDGIPGQKGIIVKGESRWKSWINEHKDDKNDWLVQEIILGSEDNIMLTVSYRNKEGKIIDSYCARKVRQYPSGFGSASLVVSEPSSDVESISTNILQKTNYHGVCSGEFKWCMKREKWIVIEFNPRPALWFYASFSSGHRIVSHSICQLLNIATPKDLPKKIVLWRYGLKDIYSKIFYRHNNDFVLPPPDEQNHLKGLSYTKVYPVFSLIDIKPFFIELWTYVKKGVSRFGK